MIINNLAGGEVEITDIKRFLGGTEYDISDIYFGDKHIFESWRELESPLPITILAAGEDLIDYRIYGNTVGGESVGERTENLYNGAIGIDNARYNTDRGEIAYDTRYEISELIPVLPNTDYTLSWDHVKETSRTSFMLAYYDLSGINSIGTSVLGIYTTGLHFSITVNTPTNCGFVRLQRKKQFDFNMMFNLGSTAPTSYIPYGYQLPMVVRSRNLFDKNFEQGFYRLDDGGKGSSLRYVRSNDKIPVSSDETYTVTYTCPKEGVPLSGVGRDSYILFWEADSSYIGYQQIMEKGNQTFTTPSNAAYVGFNIGAGSSGDGTLTPSDVSNFMLNTGSTALPYQPYFRTDVPIYIGSDPLAEDEYVDFGKQKVYRRTENLWNPNTAEKKRIAYDGTIINGNNYALNTIPVEPGLNYVFYSAEVLSNGETFYQFRDDNDEIVGSERNSRGLQRALFTAPENATKVLICFSLAWEDGIIRDFGIYQMDTLPSEYIPYIAPTDPPVPIPALPTIEGETIIDYNQSETPAVEPEKMYIKYKPQ